MCPHYPSPSTLPCRLSVLISEILYIVNLFENSLQSCSKQTLAFPWGLTSLLVGSFPFPMSCTLSINVQLVFLLPHCYFQSTLSSSSLKLRRPFEVNAVSSYLNSFPTYLSSLTILYWGLLTVLLSAFCLSLKVNPPKTLAFKHISNLTASLSGILM